MSDKGVHTNDQKYAPIDNRFQKQTETSEEITRRIESHKVPRSVPKPLRPSGEGFKLKPSN